MEDHNIVSPHLLFTRILTSTRILTTRFGVFNPVWSTWLYHQTVVGNESRVVRLLNLVLVWAGRLNYCLLWRVLCAHHFSQNISEAFSQKRMITREFFRDSAGWVMSFTDTLRRKFSMFVVHINWFFWLCWIPVRFTFIKFLRTGKVCAMLNAGANRVDSIYEPIVNRCKIELVYSKIVFARWKETWVGRTYYNWLLWQFWIDWIT